MQNICLTKHLRILNDIIKRLESGQISVWNRCWQQFEDMIDLKLSYIDWCD